LLKSKRLGDDMDNEIMTLDEILQDSYYLEQFNKKIKSMADVNMEVNMKDQNSQSGASEAQITEQSQSEDIKETELKQKTISRTQEEDNELFKKESIKTKKSLYTKLGVKDDDEFENIQALLQAERERKQKEEADKPLLEKLQGELEERKKNDEETAKRLAKLAALEQKETVNAALLKLYGKDKALDLSSVDTDYVTYLANQKISDAVTFDEAVETVLKEKPPIAKLPEMAGGAGTKPVSKTEEEALRESYKQAAKQGKSAEMSRLIREAKRKNIELE